VAEPAELKLIVSRSHRPKEVDRVAERLGITREATSGSVGLKIGVLAVREADLYVHPSGHTWAWDSCGPEAVLRAAGGRFTDLGGVAKRYGGADLRNHTGILACNAAAFDAVLPVVREVALAAGLITASPE
jgi:3'(2'), 5'-bisphosphate nucleotidase